MGIPEGFLMQGTTRTPQTPLTSPEQCKHAEAAAQDTGKLEKKLLQNSILGLKYRTEKFPRVFYSVGWYAVLQTLPVSIRNMWMCAKNPCSLKPVWKNKKKKFQKEENS